jgi:hypothetical protein
MGKFIYQIHKEQSKREMAIVYRDIYCCFSSVKYNGTILPYGITMPMLNFTDEDAVSPPCSPRAEGDVEVRPRIIFHEPLIRWIFPRTIGTSEMKFHQHKFSKYPSKKNMNKILRKTHKLKQPGGASCNQRR